MWRNLEQKLCALTQFYEDGPAKTGLKVQYQKNK